MRRQGVGACPVHVTCIILRRHQITVVTWVHVLSKTALQRDLLMMDHPNETASPSVTLMFRDSQGKHPVHSYLRWLVQRGPNSVLGQRSVVTVHLPVDAVVPAHCHWWDRPPCPHIPIPVTGRRAWSGKTPKSTFTQLGRGDHLKRCE